MKLRKSAYILLLVAALAFVREARADTCAKDLMPLFTGPQAEAICASFSAGMIGTLANDTYAVARNAGDTANINVWKVDGSDDTVLNADSGDDILLSVAATPIVKVKSTGAFDIHTVAGANAWSFEIDGDISQNGTNGGNLFFQKSGTGVILPVYVPTMAATPVAGTNQILPGYNIVPTAAANTAAMLRATPVFGERYEIYNSGPNTVRIKAGGAATMNGATAGGYLGLATLLSATCLTTSTSNYDCRLNVNPTPAGP